MKKISVYLLCAVQLISMKAVAQCNLVPNSGFENVTNCTTGWGGVYLGYAMPWDSPTNGTPDYFNTCISSSNGSSLPYNLFGFQNAHSGNGYANIVSFAPSVNNIREYLQVELDSNLVSQATYCVSFYVSNADSSGIGTNNIGLYFSDSNLNVSTSYTLNFIPQINHVGILGDTLNWTEISGTYLAQGGERYIIIGNFYADSLTDTVAIQTPRPWNTHSGYYYVDDVDVHLCTCNVGVDEESESNKVAIYPNPSEGVFEIKSNNYKIKNVEVFDVLGEKIKKQWTIDNGQWTTDLKDAAKGIYFIQVETEKGFFRKKIVVQ